LLFDWRWEQPNMSHRILVTGTSGFAGGHIATYLYEHNHEVFAHQGRQLSGDITVTPWSSGLPGHVDVLIHTAAVSPDVGIQTKDLTKNIQITQNLIDYAKNRGFVKKIIFFSSVSLYGEVRGEFLHENSPRINPSVYGETKYICEELLRTSGIPTASLRLPAVLGRGAKRHWPARLMESWRRREEIVVHNPYCPYNNAVHIQYLCELIEHLVEHDWPGQAFLPIIPASGGNPLPEILEVVDIIAPNAKLTLDISKYYNNFVIDASSADKLLPVWSTLKAFRQYVKDEE
jgi:nucleoside-diphosphate-sugar epimerase